jgi:hypothetical protein
MNDASLFEPNQGGTTELFRKPPSLGVGRRLLCFYRLLKTAVSFVLALKSSSTYPGGYACSAFCVCGFAERPF